MEREKTRRNPIDETLDGSYPASDPPGWTLGHDVPPEELDTEPPQRSKARRGREKTDKANTGRSGKG